MQKQVCILGLSFGLFLIVGLSLTQPVTAASLTFTDWTSVNTTTDVAVGTLGPVGVTLSGHDIFFGITDESFTGFNQPFFTPPLATSDVVEVIGANPPSTHTYTVTFSMPVTNPRLHIRTLASTLTFSTMVTRLSGQADFVVAGNTVTGAFHDTTDSNGTIELPGTFSSFTFTAQAIQDFGGVGDGIDLQIGADIVDHFLGYKIKPTKNASEVFTPPAAVTLTEHSGASALFDVKKPLLLYTPANKNGEGVVDENTHLEAYSLKLTRTAPPQPKPTGRTNVHLHNQFGDIFVDVGKPDRLLVPTAKNLTGPAALLGPHSVDHYRCDRVKTIKGTKFILILGVSIDDQFIADPGKQFDLKKLSRLCTPVQKNDEAAINNPDIFLLCYQARIARQEPKHVPHKGVHLHNQLGRNRLTPSRKQSSAYRRRK